MTSLRGFFLALVLAGSGLLVARGAEPVLIGLCCSRLALSCDGTLSTVLSADRPLPNWAAVRLEIRDAKGRLIATIDQVFPQGSTHQPFEYRNPRLSEGGTLHLTPAPNSPPGIALRSPVVADVVPNVTLSFSQTNMIVPPSGSVNLAVRKSPECPGSVGFRIRQIAGERRDELGALLPPIELDASSRFDSGLTLVTITDLSADSKFVLESTVPVDPAASTFTAILGPPTFGFAGSESGAAPGTTAELLVTRKDRRLAGSFTVDYVTRDLTARSGVDYAATAGTLHFDSGEREKRVRIPILPGAALSKQFLVSLASAHAIPVADDARVTIQPTLTLDREEYHLSSDGGVSLRLIAAPVREVPLSGEVLVGTMRIPFQMPPNNAAFDLKLKLLPFSSPQPIRVVDCTNCREDTSLRSRATLYPHGTSVETVFITDNTSAWPVEGSKVFLTLNRSGRREGRLEVTFTAASGTADAGDDFAPTSGKLVFAPGEAAARFPLDIVRDALKEGAEAFHLDFHSDAEDVHLPPRRTIVINDYLEEAERFFGIGCDGQDQGKCPQGIEGETAQLYIGNIWEAETFRFWATDQTARAGTDYRLRGEMGTNGFPVQIELIDNGLVDGKRTFLLHAATTHEPFVTNSFPFTIHDNEIPNTVDESFRPEFPPGWAEAPATAEAVLPFPDGSFLFYSRGRVLHLGSTGALLQHSVLNEHARVADFLSGGRLIAAVSQTPESQPFELVAFSRDGRREPDFSPDLPTGQICDIAATAGNRIWVLLDGLGSRVLLRLNSNGTRDPSFEPLFLPMSVSSFSRPVHEGEVMVHGVYCVPKGTGGCSITRATIKDGIVTSLNTEDYRFVEFQQECPDNIPWHPLLGSLTPVASLPDGKLIAWHEAGEGPRLVRLLPDPPRSPHQLLVRQSTSGEEAGQIQVELFRTGEVTDAASIRVRTEDPISLLYGETPASIHRDYTPIDQTVQFLPGQVSAVVQIPVTQDLVSEGLEALRIGFPEASTHFAMPVSGARIAIVDDDPGLAPHIFKSADGTPALRIANSSQRAVEVLASEDLVHWTPVAVRQGDAITIPLDAVGQHRFFRLRTQ